LVAYLFLSAKINYMYLFLSTYTNYLFLSMWNEEGKILKYYTCIYTISSDGRNILIDKCVLANDVITFV
jgi:hypothetical protein